MNSLKSCNHTYVPLYRDRIGNLHGLLNLRKTLIVMQQDIFNKKVLLSLSEKVYSVSESALTSDQLLNLRRENKSVGIFVDKYSEIQGLVILQDMLEEIVGEFSLDLDDFSEMLKKQKDGSHFVKGNMDIRDLSRIAEWGLPQDGLHTLSGRIIEHMETITHPEVARHTFGYLMDSSACW